MRSAPRRRTGRRLVALYSELAAHVSSPIVELNRAVAISYLSGPEAALPYVDLLVGTAPLARYHLLYSVRGDLLERLGRHDEAAAEFDRAVALATNEAERALLEDRSAVCRDRVSPVEG